MNTGDVIIDGWLVKSPPEQKSSRYPAPWRFVFRAKWKRRFFVLHKPLASLPGCYALDYYEDDSCRHRNGSIDLEQTEQIISSLDSSHYAHLFAIKTKFRRKDRTYYLAVDSENEMNKWVECLCRVCGLRPEDVPDSEEVNTPQLVEEQNIADVAPVKPPVPSVPVPVAEPAVETQSTREPESPGDSYVRLVTCGFGEENSDRVSLGSIPDNPPPPPPIDASPSDDEYKVPPRRDITFERNNSTNSDLYDVPPSIVLPIAGTNGRRDSSSSSAKRGSSACTSTLSGTSERSSFSGPTDIYDVPPTRYPTDDLDRKMSNSAIADDVYDVPPSSLLNKQGATASNIEVPPPRPPRTSFGSTSMEKTHKLMYENLPPNSRAHPDFSASEQYNLDSSRRSFDEIYDFPKPQPNNVPLVMSPPPPNSAVGVMRHYVNTVPPSPNDVLNPMSDRSNNNTKGIEEDMSTSFGCVMNRNGDLQALRDSSINDNIYQVPPSNQPVVKGNLRQQVPVPAPRASIKKDTAKGSLPEDTYTIYPTSRTRSFKKDRMQPSPPTTRLSKPQPVISETIGIPMRTGGSTDSSSSEDEEDSLSEHSAPPSVHQRSHGKSLTLPSNEKPQKQPGEIKYLDLDFTHQKEVQYLDLDLQATPEKKPVKRSPKMSKSSAVGKSSPTEYKEIDIFRTQALSETRKTLEKENKRKNSDAISPP